MTDVVNSSIVQESTRKIIMEKHTNTTGLYYRSSLTGCSMTFPKKRSMIQFLKAPTITKMWNIRNILMESMVVYPPPILACEMDEEGTGILLTKATNINTESGCPVELIRKGFIRKAAIPEGGFFFIPINTYFVIPETCYNSSYENALLPVISRNSSAADEIRFFYMISLSEHQIPIERYGAIYNSFLRKIFYIPESNSNMKKTDDYSMSPPRLLTKVQVPLDHSRMNDFEEELYSCHRNMFISNEATVRITTTPDISICKGLHLKFPRKKLKLDPSLCPKPVDSCEIYARFFAETTSSLSKYCSYAYQDSQYSLFKKATNHLIKGTVIGGVIGCCYLNDHPQLERSYFVETPIVEVLSYAVSITLSFACVYPPDSEYWKQYAVCTSMDTINFDYRHDSYNIDLNKEGFFCVKEEVGGKSYQPYCVFQTAYTIESTNILSSFVRYMPSERGWIDIQNEDVPVYCQVKTFVSLTLGMNDVAVVPEYRSEIKFMIGTPKNQSDAVGEMNTLNMSTYISPVDSDYVQRDWTKIAEGGTLVFNDFCYFTDLTASPTDYSIVSQDVEADPTEVSKDTVVSKYMYLLSNECIHLNKIPHE